MLTCGACSAEYPDHDAPWQCDCGHALDFAEQPRPERGTPPAHLDRDRGLWAFESFLPVERRVTLGEGWTPLVDAPDWDVRFKLESIFPTGSFKDRGATATISRAAELGLDRVVEDSSGNAGLAIATYAARAGIEAEIYVPADAKAGKIRAIERTGADVVRVEGSRRDVTDACLEIVESPDRSGWYASHAWNPAFFAGTSTFAMELAAQRGWTAPDAVVTPLGHGTLLLGAYRGFRALRDAGWTDSMPALLGAQATGAALIADALGDEASEGDCDSPGETDPPNDAAAGIQIREPARREQILDAITATDGDAIAVGPGATEREHDRLARAGFHVEPTSATATAALDRFRERGVIEPDDDVVVALTGTGLKG